MANATGSKNTFVDILDTQESTDTSRGKMFKSERSRRSWSSKEEEVLLATLKDLVAHGWKSDNGFRSGYLNKIEEALRREFPTSELKVNPHITSKITAWKKNYYSLVGILGRSGVGFNENGDFKIHCENDQWEQIVKIDSNARFMRNKPWPFWEEWKEIFGKDRANGENAEDVLEQVNELCGQENLGDLGSLPDDNASLDELFAQVRAAGGMATEGLAAAADSPERSVCRGVKMDVKSKQANKKRKAANDLDNMFVLLNKMHEDANARLQLLSNRIGYEVDLAR